MALDGKFIAGVLSAVKCGYHRTIRPSVIGDNIFLRFNDPAAICLCISISLSPARMYWVRPPPRSGLNYWRWTRFRKLCTADGDGMGIIMGRMGWSKIKLIITHSEQCEHIIVEWSKSKPLSNVSIDVIRSEPQIFFFFFYDFDIVGFIW